VCRNGNRNVNGPQRQPLVWVTLPTPLMPHPAD
jgi:hypothetical protein